MQFFSYANLPDQVVYQLPRWDLEADDRIDKIQLVIIPEKNVITILPDISNEQKLIPELIPTLPQQAQGREMPFNLLVVRTPFGSYREYRIRRLAPSISASFIGKRLFKHSDAAEIKKRSLSCGRERMKDATVTSVPSRRTFSNAFGMALSP